MCCGREAGSSCSWSRAYMYKGLCGLRKLDNMYICENSMLTCHHQGSRALRINVHLCAMLHAHVLISSLCSMHVYPSSLTSACVRVHVCDVCVCMHVKFVCHRSMGMYYECA